MLLGKGKGRYGKYQLVNHVTTSSSTTQIAARLYFPYMYMTRFNINIQHANNEKLHNFFNVEL